MVEQKLSAIDLIDEEDEYLIKLGLMGLEDDWPELELMGAEDGMLLFATVLEPKLYLWSMEVGLNGAVTWAQRRAIELEPLLPSGALFDVSVVGFAEGVGVIFLSTKAGLYTIELSSGRCKKDSIRYNTITGADDKGFVVPGISTLLSCTGGSSYRNSHKGPAKRARYPLPIPPPFFYFLAQREMRREERRLISQSAAALPSGSVAAPREEGRRSAVGCMVDEDSSQRVASRGVPRGCPPSRPAPTNFSVSLAINHRHVGLQVYLINKVAY
ncbi:hypothetical protein ZWY2020_007084 [Hordeum vulgare]|nr:hypothetical protein ZWY2020_007084 [Hordeum vulgare]